MSGSFLSAILNKFTNWISFNNIFVDSLSDINKRSRVASTFNVLLDLFNEQKIDTKQSYLFGEIHIKENKKD